MTGPWRCPHCPKEITEDDLGFRRIAINAHAKTHQRKPDGPRRGGRKERDWSDAIGDVIEGAIDGIARIFD